MLILFILTVSAKKKQLDLIKFLNGKWSGKKTMLSSNGEVISEEKNDDIYLDLKSNQNELN